MLYWIAHNIDELIIFAGGLFGCYIAWRPVPPSASMDWHRWHASWGRWLKLLGPALIIMAILSIAVYLVA